MSSFESRATAYEDEVLPQPSGCVGTTSGQRRTAAIARGGGRREAFNLVVLTHAERNLPMA